LGRTYYPKQGREWILATQIYCNSVQEFTARQVRPRHRAATRESASLPVDTDFCSMRRNAWVRKDIVVIFANVSTGEGTSDGFVVEGLTRKKQRGHLAERGLSGKKKIKEVVSRMRL
jgi:hypothetical protein